MRRNLLFIFALLVVAFSPCVCSAQKVQEKEYEISPRDKAELQRLSKRFVKRMQQTRDVEPLVPEFYLKDLDVLLGKWAAFGVQQEGGPKLTMRQYVEVWTAVTNRFFLGELSRMVSSNGDLSNILPIDLAEALEDFPDEKKEVTGPLYLAKLRKWEKNFRAAKAELRNRNYERSSAYKKKWKERVKAGDYNYVVTSRMDWDPTGEDGDKDIPPEMKRRYPKGLRTFDVTTPTGLSPMFVKDHGRFKILFVWISVGLSP